MASAAIVGKSSFYKMTSTTSAVFSEVALANLGDNSHYQPSAISNWFWDENETLTIEKRLHNKLSTSQGSNKDLKFVAKTYGVTPTITYTDPGVEGSLSVAVVGVDITVTLACNVGGEEISTASEIMAAVNDDVDAAALVEAYLATGSSGAGVPAGMVQTALSGEATWAEVSSGITTKYLPAIVTFGTALEEHDEVRASGKKFPVSEVANAYGFDTGLSRDMKDATVFSSGNNREFVAGNFGGSVDVSEYFVSPGHNGDLGSKLIVVAFVDVDSTPYDLIIGFGYLSGYKTNTKQGELVDSSMTWTYTGEVAHYHTDYS